MAKSHGCILSRGSRITISEGSFCRQNVLGEEGCERMGVMHLPVVVVVVQETDALVWIRVAVEAAESSCFERFSGGKVDRTWW